MLPLVDVLGVFKPRKHSRTSKNDIADVTGLPHIPEEARWNNMQCIDVFRVPTVREKSVKNEKSSRSGKSQGILS